MTSRLRILTALAGFALMLAPDDGAGSGDPAAPDPSAPAAGDAGDGAGGATTEPPAGRTFTQEDVDRIAAQRAAAERKRFEKELSDYAAAEGQTETERLKSQLAEKDTALTAAQRKVVESKVESAAERAAVSAGVKADRVALFMRNVDLDDLDQLAPDGKPDSDAIKAAVDAALALVPEFKGSAAAPTPTSGDLTGAEAGATKLWTRDEIDKLSPAEYEKHSAEIEAQMRAGKIKA